MNFIIMHQTVAKHDAIGNDIEAMYHILKEIGTCAVYAQNQFNNKVEYIESDAVDRMIKDTSTVIIYHHSVFWQEGEEILRKAKCPIIFRYHNITPEEFFKDYNEHHYSQCKKGREQTNRLAEDFPEAFWLLASNYNGLDVQEVTDSRKAICAPFNKIESWAGAVPEEEILKNLLESKDVNLLFVSRVAPNKGHLFLIDALYQYIRSFDANIKLHIIGKFDDGLQGYNNLITDKIKKYGLEEKINFIGEVNDPLLVSYYLGCDFFVCASDHEGFGVPLLEAQYFQLPVIAKDTSAVSETLGENQIVLKESIKQFAAAMAVVYKNPSYYKTLQKYGKENYLKRFTYSQNREAFLNALKKFKVIE